MNICIPEIQSEYRSVKPARIFGAVAAAILCLSLFLALLIPQQAFAQPDTVQVYQTVIIEKNDTLWDFAVQYSAEGQDIRSYIQKIRTLNHLTTDTLIEGQYLILPIEKSIHDMTYR